MKKNSKLIVGAIIVLCLGLAFLGVYYWTSSSIGDNKSIADTTRTDTAVIDPILKPDPPVDTSGNSGDDNKSSVSEEFSGAITEMIDSGRTFLVVTDSSKISYTWYDDADYKAEDENTFILTINYTLDSIETDTGSSITVGEEKVTLMQALADTTIDDISIKKDEYVVMRGCGCVYGHGTKQKKINEAFTEILDDIFPDRPKNLHAEFH